jgi:hypothetical protein
MRRQIRGWAAVVAAGLLAGCAPPPPDAEARGPGPSAGPPSAEPVAVAPIGGGEAAAAGSRPGTAAGTGPASTGPAGLQERLPDTCGLDAYRPYVGRDGVTAASQVVDRPVRVIAPDAIVSQVYNPRRVNFYTDAEGRVARVSCG